MITVFFRKTTKSRWIGLSKIFERNTGTISLTEVAFADPVSNLLSDARQLAVVVDSGHTCLCERDLVQNVPVKLSWSNHSDRDDLNACRTSLAGSGHCLLWPNRRRPVSNDDSDPRRQRSRPGVSLKDLVSEGVEGVGQVVASVAKIADSSDARLGRLTVVVFTEAELDASSVSVTDERNPQRVLCDCDTVEHQINEGNHLGPGGLTLGLG